MKLVEFEEKYGKIEKKETLIDKNNDKTYYKLMTVEKTDNYDLSCYANFDDVVYVEKKGDDLSITTYNELGSTEKTEHTFNVIGHRSKNQHKLDNLIYNAKSLEKQTRKYKLKSIGETALFGSMLALPVAVGIVAGNSLDAISGIGAGFITVFGEIATFSLITDGTNHYNKNYQDQKKLSINIEKNNACLDEAYMKKILFEPVLQKNIENVTIMENANMKRNQLLSKPDEFSESAEKFIRSRKK